MRDNENRTARAGAGAVGGALLVGALLGGLLAGCAGPSVPGAHHSTRSAPASPSSASPSPDASTPSPRPSSSPGAPTSLPAAAARRWVSPADPALSVDLRTPKTIDVGAGCLSFTGDLTTTAAPTDPAAGAPAGPTVGIAIAPRNDGKAHCMAMTVEQQDFVSTLRQATTLTVVGDRLILSGGGASLQLTAG